MVNFPRHPPMSRRTELILVTLILLLGAGLRLYRLDDIPPGWRDDEVVETAVHVQMVLAGEWPIYFPQADGEEPLYHYLGAGLVALTGVSLFTVRLLSAFFGVFSLAALYRFARRFFRVPTALIVTLALAVSFWGLMFARFKLRNLSTLGPMLLAFDLFLPRPNHPTTHTSISSVSGSLGYRTRFALAGLWLGVTLYTYFAARVAPLILLAFGFYLLLFHRETFRLHWRGFTLAFLAAALLTAPLAWAIARVPGGEARLSIVGQPLHALLRGDFTGVLNNARATLGLFGFTGDPEVLYNIPGRPVFEWLGAALFLAGVLICLWRWREPVHAFLLIWLMGGLAPAFVSVPGASLGHTIVAQPVMYLFPAIALVSMSDSLLADNFISRLNVILSRAAAKNLKRLRPFASLRVTGGGASAAQHPLPFPAPFALFAVRALPAVTIAAFLGLTAARDLRDYFVIWPALPEVRYLYRADLHAVAAWLNAHPASPDVALASRGLHRADVTALQLDTPRLGLRPRLFDPARAAVYPANGNGSLMILRESTPEANELIQGWPVIFADAAFTILAPQPLEPTVSLAANFANGFTFLGYTLSREASEVRLAAFWETAPSFTPPPPRSVEAPRPDEAGGGWPAPLKLFTHVLNPDGSYLTGDDRLDLDPATLRAGDQFAQLFRIVLPSDVAPVRYPLSIGLYNPVTGERVLRTTGEDHLTLTTLDLP